MSSRRGRVILGSSLVGLGLLLVAASFMEQPGRSKSAPNRFYSEEESGEYQTDADYLRSLMFGAIGTGGSDTQLHDALGRESPDEGEGDDQPKLSELPDDIEEVSDRVKESKATREAAYVNQQRLSRALKWLGVIGLAAGTVLLLRARRAVQADHGGTALEAKSE